MDQSSMQGNGKRMLFNWEFDRTEALAMYNKSRKNQITSDIVTINRLYLDSGFGTSIN